MECPKCKTNDLRQKGFDSSLHCNQCDGMWLESEKLPNFIKDSHDIQINEAGTSENDMRTGFCPSGHGIMTRARIDTDEPFYLKIGSGHDNHLKT